jgi:hypothetical protein
MRVSRRTATVFAVAAIAASAVARGQATGPEDFGPGGIVEVFGVRDFHPYTSGTGYTTSYALPIGQTRYVTSGPGILTASANRFPEGAYVLGFDVEYYDLDPSFNLGFRFCRYIRDVSDAADPKTQCLVQFQSAGTPGLATALVTLAEIDRTIRFQRDFDGDGAVEAADYYVEVDMPASSLVRIAGVRARWKRLVSPAPAAARFLDVPNAHPFYQFVEALAAANITAGCGGGNYCPDDPLTRGQMAVFLAVALGLYWPAF